MRSPYRKCLGGRVQPQRGRQHGRAEGEAGAAGVAALAAGATRGVPTALPDRALWLLLDHQDLVVAEVAQQRVVRVCYEEGESRGSRGCGRGGATEERKRE